ncbi:MAG: hypothetical protein Q8L48_39610 [Archangium sp.]|nr:hypothetical protein [Archangium sp.]
MRVRVFLQEPPVDARWTVGGQALTFTPCCSARDVTLTLTDADLTVP